MGSEKKPYMLDTGPVFVRSKLLSLRKPYCVAVTEEFIVTLFRMTTEFAVVIVPPSWSLANGTVVPIPTFPDVARNKLEVASRVLVPL